MSHVAGNVALVLFECFVRQRDTNRHRGNSEKTSSVTDMTTAAAVVPTGAIRPVLEHGTGMSHMRPETFQIRLGGSVSRWARHARALSLRSVRSVIGLHRQRRRRRSSFAFFFLLFFWLGIFFPRFAPSWLVSLKFQLVSGSFGCSSQFRDLHLVCSSSHRVD